MKITRFCNLYGVDHSLLRLFVIAVGIAAATPALAVATDPCETPPEPPTTVSPQITKVLKEIVPPPDPQSSECRAWVEAHKSCNDQGRSANAAQKSLTQKTPTHSLRSGTIRCLKTKQEPADLAGVSFQCVPSQPPFPTTRGECGGSEPCERWQYLRQRVFSQIRGRSP